MTNQMNRHCSQDTAISALIVNHNAGSLLSDCVNAALGQVQQITIVDNASTDTSIADLNTRFPNNDQIKIIHSNINLGFSAGCNLGLKSINTPYILFLNPDCILQPNTIQNMSDTIESNEKIGMVGGYLINPDGTEQGGGRRAIPTPWRAFVRAFGLYHLEKFWPQLFFDFHLDQKPLPKIPIEVEAISGALMLVRHNAIETVGNWDKGYFLHCEDLDWCMRFRLKGWKIFFVPNAPVIHYRGTCSHARPFFVTWHKHKGMLRFYQKFFRHKYPKILMICVTCGIWLRFAATVLFHSTRYLYQLATFKHG